MAATDGARVEAGRLVFSRVLVGLDGSPHALEAARQAAVLRDLDGHLTLLAAWEVAPALVGGTGSRIPYYLDEQVQRQAAERALATARDAVSASTAPAGKVVHGVAAVELLQEIDRNEDTLVAIGGRDGGRLVGIVAGAVATELVHRAPCSVLVARRAGADFPRRILVGVDGSAESAAAYAAARHLAERFGADLRALVAWGGKPPAARMVALITGGEQDESRATPVEALGEAAESADLVVVGSRGLHGVCALGSVSERVAHAAPCSSLVVREPVWQRVAEELGSAPPDRRERP